MSGLLDRIHAAQACGELWANRLHRETDGTFTRLRRFPARDETGWAAA